jgi:hypothetical protein
MRVFCFIFSIYLLLLSVQPCQDFATSEFSRPQIESEQAQLHNDENTESESRECSPFCICSCRQVSVADKMPVLASGELLAVFTKSVAGIFYQSNYSHQHLNSIWQPPRI